MFDESPNFPYQNLCVGDYHDQFAERDHFLLDVRELVEYVGGRIPGAVNIPLNQVPARLSEIPHDKPVVVVCEHGIRSVMAAEYLAHNGFKNLYNLTEGTFGWMMRRYPLEQ
jgi:rhodanese-related sulfurtransferase